MPTYGMGEAMREMRIRMGYTQEELAYGICTPGTLSRIENGKAAVSKKVFEALCSRMPGLHHAWVSCDTKKEMRRSKLCKQILMHLEMKRLPEAKDAMEQYESLMDEKNPFCRQFALYTQAIYQAASGAGGMELLPKLRQALAITMPDGRERLLSRKKEVVLTYDEVYILSNMGIAYAKGNEMDISVWILSFLKEYIGRQWLDWAESMQIAPMISGNMAWVLERQGRPKEAVKHCDDGIEICRYTGKFSVLPHLLCIQARCLTAADRPKMSEKSRRQAQAILDITEEYRGYGCFQEFYQAREPIFVAF